VDFLLQRIVPKHTIKIVMTLLLTAERQMVKSQHEMVEIKEDGDEVSYHCNPKHDHRQWCKAPSFLVINRSTTIPMPTETEWKEQSLLDPDILVHQEDRLEH
jgi:hypothetical protein